MGGFFLFLYQIRNLLVFLLLELLSVYLIVVNNRFQGIVWMHSSNQMVGRYMEVNNQIYGYFDLAYQNENLARENAQLRQLINQREQVIQGFVTDTLKNELLDTLGGSKAKQYNYLVAKVINNSISMRHNYITIDKGALDGVKPGMGVLSPTGIVGKVLLCSDHYSTVNSLLHTNFTPAAAIKGSNATGTLVWRGNDPKVVNLEYIARHLKPKVGDTIITSNTSDIFPANLPVGRIKQVNITSNGTFYDIQVDLSTDFSSLGYVYLINNQLQTEKDSLELKTRVKFTPLTDKTSVARK